MCRVSQCCCGCSLETGCKILAILGLIFGGLGLIQGIASLSAEASNILEIVFCAAAEVGLEFGDGGSDLVERREEARETVRPADMH